MTSIFESLFFCYRFSKDMYQNSFTYSIIILVFHSIGLKSHSQLIKMVLYYLRLVEKFKFILRMREKVKFT